MSRHPRKTAITTLVVCAFAVLAKFLTPALRAQGGSAPPDKSEKKADPESGDKYDKLYELRMYD